MELQKESLSDAQFLSSRTSRNNHNSRFLTLNIRYSSRFVVKGGQMFNAVVRLCLSKMEPALRKVLRLEKEASERMKAKKLQKSKKWTACNRPLKSYTLELVRLLSVLSESSVASALLKHVHVMLPFFSALPKSRKQG